MGAAENWVDLLDPTPAELDAYLPASIHSRSLEQLLAPARHEDDPRPKLEKHGDYIFGVFLIVVALQQDDLVYYQAVDLVLTESGAVTVRKTPEQGVPPTTRRQRGQRVVSATRSAWSPITSSTTSRNGS